MGVFRLSNIRIHLPHKVLTLQQAKTLCTLYITSLVAQKLSSEAQPERHILTSLLRVFLTPHPIQNATEQQ